jgi:hypothetical protein
VDVEHWFGYGYIDHRHCWALTYSRARDNLTGYDTGPQYPDTCVD